jgi:VWFA-related protein
MPDFLTRRRFVALAAVPAIAAPQAEFSSAVSVVSLLVTVRDKGGKFVNDLTQGDFAVSEDGHPQTISYFSRQYDLPLTLGLLVDTSGSQKQVLGEEVSASAKFFQQVLREDRDQAFLTSFDDRTYMRQNITMQRAQLDDALQKLDAELKGHRYQNGTILYDVLIDTAGSVMKRYMGRKALVLLTDGEDTASRASLERAVEACQRADTAVYSIGLGSGLMRGWDTLDTLAQKTGGRFFDVTSKRTVEMIYQTIEEELRSQYNIGYVPPPVAGKDRTGYHKVRVSVSRPGMTARTREGYYSGG